jgi:catechol 2,3-dioxygenase-like lactoylglutathione lyase family enzyme
MTRFNSIMPVLTVSNMSKSIEWYTSVLGLELEFGVRDRDGYVLAFAEQITPDQED